MNLSVFFGLSGVLLVQFFFAFVLGVLLYLRAFIRESFLFVCEFVHLVIFIVTLNVKRFCFCQPHHQTQEGNSSRWDTGHTGVAQVT